MEGFYGRRQRKELAKKLGLVKKNETQKERSERVARSQEAGKQIHTQFISQVENDLRNQRSESEAKQLQSMIEVYGEERAKQIMANNRAVEEKRREKLRNKKNK